VAREAAPEAGTAGKEAQAARPPTEESLRMSDEQFKMTGAVLGTLLTLFGAGFLVLQIIGAWRRITVITPNAQFVTRGELDQQTAILKLDMQKIEVDVKTEIKRVESTLIGSVKELHTYTHDRFHSLAGSLQAIENNQSLMRLESMKNVSESIKPIEEKIDRLAQSLVRIEARIEQGGG
jgi:hypothetical protein